MASEFDKITFGNPEINLGLEWISKYLREVQNVSARIALESSGITKIHSYFYDVKTGNEGDYINTAHISFHDPEQELEGEKSQTHPNASVNQQASIF